MDTEPRASVQGQNPWIQPARWDPQACLASRALPPPGPPPRTLDGARRASLSLGQDRAHSQEGGRSLGQELLLSTYCMPAPLPSERLLRPPPPPPARRVTLQEPLFCPKGPMTQAGSQGQDHPQTSPGGTRAPLPSRSAGGCGPSPTLPPSSPSEADTGQSPPAAPPHTPCPAFIFVPFPASRRPRAAPRPGPRPGDQQVGWPLGDMGRAFLGHV